jgi:type I restriction enzyme S subunit
MREPLRNVAEIHYGKSPAEVLVDNSDIPILGTGGSYGRASRSLFPGPAVVVPRKGSLGNPQFVAMPFWASDTTYAVVPKTKIDAKWLYYSLDAFDLTRLNEATGVPSISRDWLYRISFETPSFSEQRRVAEILTTLDETIEQTEALIAKYQQIKAGLMHDLFTRGVTSDGRLRPTRDQAPHLYKESPLGWIAKEWSIDSIRSITSLCIDCPHTTPVLSGDVYLMARTSEIRNGGLCADLSPRVAPIEYRSRISRGIPTEGDIIFTREAPVGEAFVVPANLEICLGQRVMLIRSIRNKCDSNLL